MASTRRKKNPAKQKQVHHKNVEQRPPNQYKKSFDPRFAHKNKDRCSKCGDSIHHEGLQCPAKNSMQGMPQVWPLHKPVLPENSAKTSQSQAQKTTAYQLKAGTIHTHDSNEEVDSSDNSFCLQLKIQCVQAHNKMTQKPACLITNLAYRLKQNKNRNLYLMARLDTCADVNIMPASVTNWYLKILPLRCLCPISCR